MCWLFRHKACGILATWPGIEPAPLALEGKVWTTGALGKSPSSGLFLCISFFYFFIGIKLIYNASFSWSMNQQYTYIASLLIEINGHSNILKSQLSWLRYRPHCSVLDHPSSWSLCGRYRQAATNQGQLSLLLTHTKGHRFSYLLKSTRHRMTSLHFFFWWVDELFNNCQRKSKL